MSSSETTTDSEASSEENDWSEFLTEGVAEPTPPEAFNQSTAIPSNPFKKGHLLLATDPKTPRFKVLAKVDKVHKCWIRLRFLEFERYHVWKMCDDEALTPFDEGKLDRHPDNPRSETFFVKWIAKTMDGEADNIAPHEIFRPISPSCMPKNNNFKRGMVIALLDEFAFKFKVTPATVVGVQSTTVRLRLAGRSDSLLSDITVPCWDRRLFSLNFVMRADVAATKERVWKKGDKKAATSLKKKLRLSMDSTTERDMNELAGVEECRSQELEEKQPASFDNCVGDENIPCRINNDFTLPVNSPEPSTLNLQQENESDAQPSGSSSFEMGNTALNLMPSQYSPFNTDVISTIATKLNWTKEREQDVLKRAAEQLSQSMNNPVLQMTRKIMRLHNAYQKKEETDDTCVVQFDCSVDVGPLLDREKVQKMPLFFTRMHFLLQVQRVAQFLVYCGKSQSAVTEIIANDDPNEDAETLSIFIRGDELKSYRIPKPRNFNMARIWIRQSLRLLDADVKLIDLMKTAVLQ